MAKSQPGYHSFTALLSFIPLKKKKIRQNNLEQQLSSPHLFESECQTALWLSSHEASRTRHNSLAAIRFVGWVLADSRHSQTLGVILIKRKRQTLSLIHI